MGCVWGVADMEREGREREKEWREGRRGEGRGV